MDAERLADYLAGDLDPEQQRALEAELARDPALRARLQRMREADAALAQLPPAAPAEGFDDRLRAALAPELRHRLADERIVASGPTTHDPDEAADPAVEHPDLAAEDELSRRRERARAGRRVPRWPLAVGGAAAGLALLGVAGAALLGLPGGGDDMAADAPVTQEESAGDGAGSGGRPIVLASDRDLAEGDVSSLLDEPALAALAQRDLGAAEGGAVAADFTRVLRDDDRLRAQAGSSPVPGDSGAAVTEDREEEAAPEAEEEAGTLDADEDAEDAEPTDDAKAGDDAEAGARLRGESFSTGHLDDDARADVRRCLDTLLEGADAPIPAYVEVTRYEGEPAIAFGLLTRSAEGERYDRLEVWVLERDGCQVRTLQQRDL